MTPDCPLQHKLRLVSGRFCAARCTILSARGCPDDCEHRPEVRA